mmetsp:Transcript_23954/g.46371  ORF Transcript_23954/g.46371 Transcript_23954/m.46371 type:complete len:120 (-) Transcript_23954:109-468(-)
MSSLVKYAAPTPSKVVLMGKSWSGREALRFTSRHKAMVEKLVLIAPAVTAGAKRPISRVGGVPILLCWAEDDSMVPYKTAKMFNSVPGIKLFIVSSGGHSILPAFNKPIVDFVKGPVAA